MAHGKSARKRVRQNESHRVNNRAHLNALRTEMRKMREAVESGDAERARSEYANVVQALDKAVARGVIHANKAGRHKSRYAKQLKALSQSA